MKLIFESWRGYMQEDISPYKEQLEYDENGNLVLYHISKKEDIKELDPEIAAKSPKSYTIQEYRTWDRPRVFFFTRIGQRDTGIGEISGVAYSVRINPDQLYPVDEDPYNLLSARELQKYMVERNKEFAAAYNIAEKCSSAKEYNEWHICSKTEDANGLAWDEDRFAGKRLLIDHPKYHHQKPNFYEMAANIAETRYNSIGFIYPQSKDPNNLIVALWKKVPASRLNKSFYQEK